MEFVANFELNNNNLDASFDLSEGASFDALFEIYASGTTWGSIDGNIENQTDLYNILMSKADKTTVEADLEAINDTITENYETLDNKIDSVQSDLSGDISALSQTVINNNTAINNRVDNIVESFDGDIEQINSNITDLQTTVSDNYSELNTKIQNEAATRAENDSLLQGNINTLSDNLTAEISNRESADSGLQIQITNLTGTVSSNYNTLNNSISNLSDTVDDLSDTVDSNYNILDTKINTTQTTLQGNIDTLSGTVTSNYNDLTQSITNNVSTLNTRITNEVSTLNGAISDEATARANADNNLQTQIDAIVSSSDVFDIVGTYAELQAYDISTVPVNDIVKVLVDSTHNNAATYYRCVENAGVKSWTYIGSEGAYYTKGEADSTFVPQTRTINNKALNQNINLTASDVGALPVGTQIGNGTILLTQGGVQKGTFTLNQTGNATIDFDAVSEDITVDSELSTTSTNPVQNKVITGALNGKQDTLIAGTDLEIVQNSILPSGYTQLNSITTTGSQYINTGLWLTDNFKAEIVGRFTSTTGTQCMLGATVRTSNATYRNIVLGKNASQYYVGNGSPWYQPNQTNSSATLDTNKHTFVIEITSETTKISVDGVENTATYESSSVEEDLYLFANNAIVSGGTSSVADFAQFEAESVKLYDNGNLIFNGVPASNGSQAGLYDTVSETFMSSLGSSAFVAGDEVVTQTIIKFTNETGYITGIDSNDVTTALGYIPYNATNPNGYTSNVGTVTSVNGVQPVNGNVTIETGGTVDQVFNGESANAQSGIAIQGALDEKQDTLIAGDNIEITPASVIRVPEGYTQLQSINSAAAAMINTGLSGDIQWEIVAVGSAPYPTTRMLVSCANTTSSSAWFGEQGAMWGYGTTSTSVSLSTEATIIINFNTSSNNMNGTVNGVAFSHTATASVTGNWFLFGSPSGSYKFTGSLFSAIARQGGVVVFDGVPARRNSDNVAGLYDVVSGNFFTSTTTTAFNAGETAYNQPTISAEVGEANLSISLYNTTKATFSANAKSAVSCNLTPSIATKEISASPLVNSNTQKNANSLLYCGNDDRIHSYTETNIPISLAYGMFVNNAAISANSTFSWYYKGEKLSWTVPTALRSFTSKQKVYAKCTYPDSNGNVYFVGIVGQSNTTNALEGGYTYYYLGVASSAATVALNVSGSHFISLDTDGNLTHIDGVEVAQPNAKDLYNYYSLNAYTVGTPTVEDCIVSGFSNSDYVEMRNAISILTGFWEFQTKFTTGATVSTSTGEFQYLTKSINSSVAYGINTFLDGANPGTLNFSIGNTTTAVNANIAPNTTYTVKVVKGFTDTYAYDGKTHVYAYDETGSLINSWNGTISVTPKNLYMQFGTDGTNNFDGSIDFENTFINSIALDTSTLTGTATRVWTGAQPTIDTKADTDLNNITDSAKVMMSGMGMPSDTYIDLTLGASGSTYTAPANGYIFLNKSSSGAGQYTGITNNTSGLITEQISTANYQNLPCSLECGQGDSLTVEYTAGGALISFRFVYAQGSESEAN